VISAARGKLDAKGLDLVVANDVRRSDAGFESDTNAVTLVFQDGIKTFPLMSKNDVAECLIDWLESAIAVRP